MNEQQILGIINIARRGTSVVKIIPFVQACIYIVCRISSLFVSDNVQSLLDLLLYVSPLQVVFSLILSKTFKLCKWHKTECVLPLVPFSLVIFDTYIYELSRIALAVNITAIVCVLILSVVNAYFVFWRKPNNQDR